MPRHNLTARFIDSIKPPAEGRTEYWDASTPGFGLRVAPSGRKTWVVMYRAGGRLRRLSLGTYPAFSLGSAREAAKDALRDVAKGKDPAGIKQSERKAETFRELAEEYLERHAKRRSDPGKRTTLRSDATSFRRSAIGRRKTSSARTCCGFWMASLSVARRLGRTGRSKSCAKSTTGALLGRSWRPTPATWWRGQHRRTGVSAC